MKQKNVFFCIYYSLKSLTLLEEDIEVRIKAMKILQLLSNDEKNCERMLNAECGSRIVLKMSYPKLNDE